MSFPQKDERFEALCSISAALAEEKNLDRLLERILEKCRDIVHADAGSLFLAEGEGFALPSHLRFKLSQNESIPVTFTEFTLPINHKSLAGYVASTGEAINIPNVYEMPEDLPFSFNPDFDKQSGYLSRSVLSVAMKDQKDQLIGVMQLWNKKRNPKTQLTIQNIPDEVIPFSEDDLGVLSALSAQAGIAIENAKLYSDIQNLFEGFIRASVLAIESRDPTTSGHSERVADMTCFLAQSVDRSEEKVFQGLAFSHQEMQELKYAALLHDFGKIGVRESVLVKAKKLYPHEFEIIASRFDLLILNTQLEHAQNKIDYLQKGGAPSDARLKEMDQRLEARMEEIREAYELITASNEPTVLPESVSGELDKLSQLHVTRPDGSSTPIISPNQIFRLSVPKGSLSDSERQEIESHVTHTFQYLSRIPWTKELQRAPEIAYAHHEKLDGSGYPRKISSSQIPLQSKIMTVADIFDALAARDRPYKRAVPIPRALEILEMEVQDGKLDANLVRLFIESKGYELINKPR